MAARTLGEERVTRVKLHPRLVIRAMAAVAGNTHVPGRNALHRTIIVEQDLGSRESREDFDTQLFGLARKPAAEIAEAERVSAAVAHERRHEHFRDAELALLP